MWMEPPQKLDNFAISRTKIAQYLSTLWKAKLIDHCIRVHGAGRVESPALIHKDR